jgi:ComF family protein
MASLAEALVSTFLPAGCTLCHRPLPWRASAAGVCPSCWSLVAAHGATCPRCGEPDVDGEPCLQCRTSPPPWQAATSFGPYRGLLRQLVLALKHGRRDELARPLGDLLAESWRAATWPQPDLVTAVPMWWLRRLGRGFNQAELLARHLAAAVGAPYQPTLRRRRGLRQVGRGRAARLALSGAEFTPRRRLAGRVLLVDDVLTTGATARACCRALERAGAREIFVLTLARTERSGRIP